MKDYKAMWEILKHDVEETLAILSNPESMIMYSDIQRMASAKLLQQSMIKIEGENES